jgi:hypothetical protein
LEQQSWISDMEKPYLTSQRNAQPHALIYDALMKAAQVRRLTAVERRIRRMVEPCPWREAGISRTTYYRRRNRVALREGATA